MKHMKLSEEEKSGNTQLTPAESKSEYPYGLQIHLTEHELGKLGMKNLPEPGTKLTVGARTHVIGAMMHEGSDGPHKMLHLQITHMTIGGDKEGHDSTDGETKGKKLYGDK